MTASCRLERLLAVTLILPNSLLTEGALLSLHGAGILVSGLDASGALLGLGEGELVLGEEALLDGQFAESEDELVAEHLVQVVPELTEKRKLPDSAGVLTDGFVRLLAAAPELEPVGDG